MLWNSIFVCIIVVSLFWAWNRQLVVSIFPIMLVRVLFGLYALNYMSNVYRTLTCIRSLVITGGYMMLRMLIYMVWHPANYLSNVAFYEVCTNACDSNFNQVAQLLGFTIVFAFYLYEKTKNKGYLVYIALAFIFIFLTGSRKGFVMPFMGIVYLIFLRDMKRFEKQLKNIGLVLLGCVVLLIFLETNPVYAERLNIVIQAVFLGKSGDLSTYERLHFSTIAMDMFRQKPLLGWGANNFRGVLASTGFDNVVYCHNNYLEIASGLGVLGLVSYYWFYARSLLKGLRYLKRYPEISLAVSIFVIFIVFEYGIVTYLFSIYMYIFLVAYVFMIHSIDKR